MKIYEPEATTLADICAFLLGGHEPLPENTANFVSFNGIHLHAIRWLPDTYIVDLSVWFHQPHLIPSFDLTGMIGFIDQIYLCCNQFAGFENIYGIKPFVIPPEEDEATGYYCLVSTKEDPTTTPYTGNLVASEQDITSIMVYLMTDLYYWDLFVGEASAVAVAATTPTANPILMGTAEVVSPNPAEIMLDQMLVGINADGLGNINQQITLTAAQASDWVNSLMTTTNAIAPSDSIAGTVGVFESVATYESPVMTYQTYNVITASSSTSTMPDQPVSTKHLAMDANHFTILPQSEGRKIDEHFSIIEEQLSKFMSEYIGWDLDCIYRYAHTLLTHMFFRSTSDRNVLQSIDQSKVDTFFANVHPGWNSDTFKVYPASLDVLYNDSDLNFAKIENIPFKLNKTLQGTIVYNYENLVAFLLLLLMHHNAIYPLGHSNNPSGFVLLHDVNYPFNRTTSSHNDLSVINDKMLYAAMASFTGYVQRNSRMVLNTIAKNFRTLKNVHETVVDDLTSTVNSGIQVVDRFTWS